jgi:DNA-binding HxlR family transcriptional regulator
MSENCNSTISASLEILVGKWKPNILFQLATNETLRFNELQRRIPGITKKMLTAQLRELEYNKIIHREVYAIIPPKVEYSITEYGKTLGPLLFEMQKWGEKHVEMMNNELALQKEESKVVVYEGKM